MRENRTYGSEGGEAKSLPYPYPAASARPPIRQLAILCEKRSCYGHDGRTARA